MNVGEFKINMTKYQHKEQQNNYISLEQQQHQMHRRSQSPVLNTKTRDKVLPYKRRLENQQKPNFYSSAILNQTKKQQVNYNPQADLKAKIIRAILTNSETIQKQINYKNSIANFITPIKSKNSILHLNLRLKNSNPKNSMSPNQHEKKQSNLVSTRYNSSLEISQIIQPLSFQIKRLKFDGETISRCLSQRTNQSSRSNSAYSSKKQRRSNKTSFKTPLTMRQKDVQIRPWNDEKPNQKQFQYF